ncbi:MAG: S-4TM family putative pore-forming effector [bacterium]
MSQTISQKQNEPEQIKRLQAQRMLYDEVRKIKRVRLLVTLVLNAIWVYYATTIWHSEILVVIGSGVLMALEYLTESLWQERVHKKAALMQELFDTEVLQLPWNEDHPLIGARPLADEVARWAAKYNEKRYQKAPLSDWYSEKVDTIPLPYARLCCQKSNIDWDVGLRKRYISSYIILLASIVAFFGIVISLWGLAEVNKLWIFFASILPILRIGWEATKGNFQAIENLKTMKSRIDSKWLEILQQEATEDEITAASRVWQDEIFRHRLLAPVLPRYLYDRKRPKDEQEMNRSSAALADEIRAILQKS